MATGLGFNVLLTRGFFQIRTHSAFLHLGVLLTSDLFLLKDWLTEAGQSII